MVGSNGRQPSCTIRWGSFACPVKPRSSTKARTSLAKFSSNAGTSRTSTKSDSASLRSPKIPKQITFRKAAWEARVKGGPGQRRKMLVAESNLLFEEARNGGSASYLPLWRIKSAQLRTHGPYRNVSLTWPKLAQSSRATLSLFLRSIVKPSARSRSKSIHISIHTGMHKYAYMHMSSSPNKERS